MLHSINHLKNIKQLLNSPSKHRATIFALSIFAIIGILLMPVPPMVMDVLLSISIAISMLILITVLLINASLDFSSFPSILLVSTMLRLALNISTTRLILANGHTGIQAAGHIVQAFGNFIIQGSLVIGVIIFIILTLINFIVITKGSGRIAEVAARFSLDAMPGKQMAIDADLSAGIIKEEEAKIRRQYLEDESNFYGTMDGANKFVRGDAIAGLLITFINFIGGVLIGVGQKGMSFSEALHTYTVLTIGDGLVSQIPALLISVSAGLLVTKSGIKGSMDQAIFEQLGKYPAAMGISSGLLFSMGVIIPGMPFLPFTIIAAILGSSAYLLKESKNLIKVSEQQKNKELFAKDQAYTSAIIQDQDITHSLKVDNITVELGYELIALSEKTIDSNIPHSIKELRKILAHEMGVILPSVHIIDNIKLQSKEYVIRIKEIEAGRGSVIPNKILIMHPDGNTKDIDGQDTTDPIFGTPAKWIYRSAKEQAIIKGYTTIEPSTIIATHVAELAKENIIELLGYGDVQALIEKLNDEHKKLIEQIVPSKISFVTIQRVLQSLLKEKVSIRDLGNIIESISELSSTTNDIGQIVEHARSNLARYISKANSVEEGYIPVLVFSNTWNQIFLENLHGEGSKKQIIMAPSKFDELISKISKNLENALKIETKVALLTSSELRPLIRALIEKFYPNSAVLSHNEIHPKIKIKTIGVIQ